MSLWDLSEEQLFELKQSLLTRIYDEMLNASPSYGELADANEIISAGLLVAFYDGTDFCDDDFFRTADNNW